MKRENFSDQDFLARLRRRDSAALTQLVDAYLPQLLRAGRGMGFSAEESEDLAQSVFTVLLENPERFEGRSHIRTYLFGIFHNKVYEYLREKQKADEQDAIDEVMESRFDNHGRWRQPPVDLERQIFLREARKIIAECLKALPRRQRIVFYLREVEEIGTDEICKKINATATNIGVLLFRARNRLRECIEKHGLTKD